MERQEQGTHTVTAEETKAQEAAAAAAPAEIDWTQQDPDGIPHHVVQQTPHFKGLVAETQTARERNRQLQEENNMLREEFARGSRQEEELDPEAPVPRKEVDARIDKAVAKATADFEKKQQEKAQTSHKTAITRGEQSLAARYSRDKMPAGLDGTTVIAEGGNWLRANEPALFNAALAGGEGAAETIYNLAVALCPAIRKRHDAVKNASLLESIKTGKAPHGPGASVEDSESAGNLASFLGLSEEETMAKIEKDELGE